MTRAPPLYFQDPSGAPFYAAGPKKTPDGRAYVPVFEDAPAGNVAAKPTSDAHRILYYRNPMGLPDTSPVPKKDAMGMDYIPVYADEAGDARGIVRISPARMQMLGVRTEEVAMRPALTRTIRATGALQFNERRLATVTTKAAGWIERLTVAATGDPVRQGEVLAELYAPDLVAAEQEYLVAARMAGPPRPAWRMAIRVRSQPLRCSGCARSMCPTMKSRGCARPAKYRGVSLWRRPRMASSSKSSCRKACASSLARRSTRRRIFAMSG